MSAPTSNDVVRALEARVEALEERVAWLEGELRISNSTSIVGAIRTKWGLSPTEARLLDALSRRRGRFTTRGFLIDMLYQSDIDQPETKIIDVMIHRIRKKVGYAASIITEPFTGYRIGDQLAVEIDRMVNQ